ncbi:MAG TPA: aspartate aminotransferase family protein, partial [Pseudolabrys sp.]|nr:aspartate aminotransferase family protein [Pseudolabrys sp.]
MAQSSVQAKTTNVPNDLESFFMPFTANRAFKARPRMIACAKGMFYYTPENRQVLDAAAGLWCTNA